MSRSTVRALSSGDSLIPFHQSTFGPAAQIGPGRRWNRPGAAVAGSAPLVGTRMELHSATHLSPPALVWDDLDPVEQSLLAAASQERTLDHACASWTDRPRRRRDIERTRAAAAKLFDHGLIGFYRVADGYPDLTDADRATIFRSNTFWDRDHCDAAVVGLFLTTAGEEVVLGP